LGLEGKNTSREEEIKKEEEKKRQEEWEINQQDIQWERKMNQQKYKEANTERWNRALGFCGFWTALLCGVGFLIIYLVYK
jgi:hypothetical protein